MPPESTRPYYFISVAIFYLCPYHRIFIYDVLYTTQHDGFLLVTTTSINQAQIYDVSYLAYNDVLEATSPPNGLGIPFLQIHDEKSKFVTDVGVSVTFSKYVMKKPS